MESQKIATLMYFVAGKIPSAQIPTIRKMAESASADRFHAIQAVPMHSPTTIVIVSILLGSCGVDRFMLGQTVLGILKLLTCGGGGIWWIIDWFLVSDIARKQNLQRILMMLS